MYLSFLCSLFSIQYIIFLVTFNHCMFSAVFSDLVALALLCPLQSYKHTFDHSCPFESSVASYLQVSQGPEHGTLYFNIHILYCTQ